MTATQPDPPTHRRAPIRFVNKSYDAGCAILALYRSHPDVRDLWHIECDDPTDPAYNNPTLDGVGERAALRKPRALVEAAPVVIQSPRPKTESPRSNVAFVCVVCDAKFFPDLRNVGRQMFCSAKCRESDKQRRVREESDSIPVGAEISCGLCGLRFVRRSSMHKYCSVSCSDKVRYRRSKEMAQREQGVRELQGVFARPEAGQ